MNLLDTLTPRTITPSGYRVVGPRLAKALKAAPVNRYVYPCGHPRTTANTYYYRAGTHRRCLACKRKRTAEYNAGISRKRAAIARGLTGHAV